MFTLFAIYMAVSITYTYMLVKAEEGQTRLESIKDELGEQWYVAFLCAAPVVTGKVLFKTLVEFVETKVQGK